MSFTQLSSKRIDKAIALSRYIINYTDQRKVKITKLMLQKMLYIIWLEFYDQTNLVLFNNVFKCWKTGPWIESVNNEYCVFGAAPLYLLHQYNNNVQYIGPEVDCLNRIIDHYSTFNQWELVNIVTQPGSICRKILEEWDNTSKSREIYIETLKKQYKHELELIHKKVTQYKEVRDCNE